MRRVANDVATWYGREELLRSLDVFPQTLELTVPHGLQIRNRASIGVFSSGRRRRFAPGRVWTGVRQRLAQGLLTQLIGVGSQFGHEIP